MSKTLWTPAEKALVKQYIEQGLNSAEVFDRLQRDGINRTQKAIQRLKERSNWHALVQPSKISLDQPITLQADRALLLFDIHAPCQAATWLNRVIDLALRWKVTACGVGGDIIDFSSVSYYGRTAGIELRDELDAGCDIVRVLAANFKHKVLAGGNHEQRISKKLTPGGATLQDVLDYFVAAPGTVTTARKWFYLASGNAKFRIVHPKNYNRIPTRNAQTLASTYKSHIVAGHNHLWGQALDVSGTWHAIDAGCCLDAKRVAWMEIEMTNHPLPLLGAVIVIEGTPILLGRHNIGLYERIAIP